MKKQMNTKTEEVKVQKREKKSRKFFLYAEGKGLVALKPDSTTPTFNDGQLLVFDNRRSAICARDILEKVKYAEKIDILTKVA